MRLSGIWFKLLEPDGFYMGILMVPKEVADGIELQNRWRVARPEAGIPFSKATTIAPNYYRVDLAPSDMSISMIDFVAADHLMRDAIMVFGISLSDLNKERGFAFIPSAEFLQRGPSLPKVEQVKAEPADSRFKVLDFT